MTRDEFNEFVQEKDYVLIRLTNAFPFFIEKIRRENGKETISNNYHEHSGMFSDYVNFEVNDIGISAEFSRGYLDFELGDLSKCIVGFENACDKDLPVKILEMISLGYMTPGYIVVVSDPELRKQGCQDFENERNKKESKCMMSQEEICNLLSGNV